MEASKMGRGSSASRTRRRLVAGVCGVAIVSFAAAAPDKTGDLVDEPPTIQKKAPPKPTPSQKAPAPRAPSTTPIRRAKPPPPTAVTPSRTTPAPHKAVVPPRAAPPRAPGMRVTQPSAALAGRIDRTRRSHRALAQMRAESIAASRELAERLEQRTRRGDDCDDARADVYPGATEVCDGVDNDCDGNVDEGQTILAYADADGDGHGDPATRIDVCPSDFRRSQDEGAWLSTTGNDCDDTDPDRWHDCR